MVAQHHIAAIVHVLEFDFFLAGTVQNNLLNFFRQFFKRRFNIEMVVFRQGREHLVIIEIATIPTFDSTIRKGNAWILYYTFFIEILLYAQTITSRTRTGRVIKGEETRFQFRHGITTVRTGKVGREHQFFRLRIVHIRDDRRAAGKLERGFKGFRQSCG